MNQGWLYLNRNLWMIFWKLTFDDVGRNCVVIDGNNLLWRVKLTFWENMISIGVFLMLSRCSRLSFEGFPYPLMREDRYWHWFAENLSNDLTDIALKWAITRKNKPIMMADQSNRAVRMAIEPWSHRSKTIWELI